MSDNQTWGFAISNSGNSWRRAYDTDPLQPGETWQATEPTPTPEFVAAQKKAQARLEEAKLAAAAIPNWAKWTEAEANTWYQTNVRDPFTAATTFTAMKVVIGTMITVLWAIIRMVIAQRDHTWPDLSN